MNRVTDLPCVTLVVVYATGGIRCGAAGDPALVGIAFCCLRFSFFERGLGNSINLDSADRFDRKLWHQNYERAHKGTREHEKTDQDVDFSLGPANHITCLISKPNLKTGRKRMRLVIIVTAGGGTPFNCNTRNSSSRRVFLVNWRVRPAEAVNSVAPIP